MTQRVKTYTAVLVVSTLLALPLSYQTLAQVTPETALTETVTGSSSGVTGSSLSETMKTSPSLKTPAGSELSMEKTVLTIAVGVASYIALRLGIKRRTDSTDF